MAISHIPRSVGHNFAPEYQISSIPYVIDLATATIVTKKFIKRDSDGLVVAETTAAGEAGHAVTTFNKIPLEDLFDNPAIKTVAQVTAKGGFTVTDAVKELRLPKISRWIQFLPTGDGIDVKFSRINSSEITFTSDTYPLEIRCVNLYLGANTNGKILVGLTSIDRTEFEEVVETFLE